VLRCHRRGAGALERSGLGDPARRAYPSTGCARHWTARRTRAPACPDRRSLADGGSPKRAAALLEPLFAGSLEDLDGEFEPSIDILCDAYDRLGHRRKKEAFLERICSEGSRALRAAAWQRRCTMAIDEGDFAEADAAFTAALRSDPDNPGTAILEITLLAAQHKDWIARERARFWLFRFRQIGFTHPGVLDFLNRAVEDPQEALVDSHSDALDPVLLDLHDWITLIQARPLPDLSLEPLHVHGPGGCRVSSRCSTTSMPRCRTAPTMTRSSASRGYAPSPARLSAPAAVRQLEAELEVGLSDGKARLDPARARGGC
jgi:tetratricopeptide (TPR) repeat protein